MGQERLIGEARPLRQHDLDDLVAPIGAAALSSSQSGKGDLAKRARISRKVIAVLR